MGGNNFCIGKRKDVSMEHTFEALGLRAALVTALAEQGITTPTEIQQKMIPEILSGKDVIGRSETGSGSWI